MPAAQAIPPDGQIDDLPLTQRAGISTAGAAPATDRGVVDRAIVDRDRLGRDVVDRDRLGRDVVDRGLGQSGLIDLSDPIDDTTVVKLGIVVDDDLDDHHGDGGGDGGAGGTGPAEPGAPVRLTSPGGASVQERLVEAAADVFAEQGYDRARVQDIAKRAGLSTGAIYGNFRDKSDLLLAAIDRGFQGVAVDLERVHGRQLSALELIEVMATSLGHPKRGRNGLLLNEALAVARHDPVAGERVRRALAKVEEDIICLIGQARLEGTVAADVDARAFARLSLALALGYRQIDAAGVPPPDRAAWATVIHRTVTGVAFVDPGAADTPAVPVPPDA